MYNTMSNIQDLRLSSNTVTESMTTPSNNNDNIKVGLNLKDHEELLLNTLPRIAAIISLGCAISMILTILRSTYYRRRIYHRIILGCAINIALLNLLTLWGSAAAPAEPADESIWGAKGTTTTCTIQGFLYHWALFVTPLYYDTLSIVSYLAFTTSRNNRNKNSKSGDDHLFPHWIEKWIHIGVTIFPLFSGIYLLTEKAYNPVIWRCGVMNYPMWCDDDRIPCQRGPVKIGRHLLYFFGIPVILIIAFPTIVMMMLYLKVRKQGSILVATSVGKQSTVYLLTLVWTYLFRFISVLHTYGQEEVQFVWNLLANINENLIGVWILLVYYYFRSRDPNSSRSPSLTNNNNDQNYNNNNRCRRRSSNNNHHNMMMMNMMATRTQSTSTNNPTIAASSASLRFSHHGNKNGIHQQKQRNLSWLMSMGSSTNEEETSNNDDDGDGCCSMKRRNSNFDDERSGIDNMDVGVDCSSCIDNIIMSDCATTNTALNDSTTGNNNHRVGDSTRMNGVIKRSMSWLVRGKSKKNITRTKSVAGTSDSRMGKKKRSIRKKKWNNSVEMIEFGNTVTSSDLPLHQTATRPEESAAFSIFDGTSVKSDSPWSAFLTEGIDDDYVESEDVEVIPPVASLPSSTATVGNAATPTTKSNIKTCTSSSIMYGFMGGEGSGCSNNKKNRPKEEQIIFFDETITTPTVKRNTIDTFLDNTINSDKRSGSNDIIIDDNSNPPQCDEDDDEDNDDELLLEAALAFCNNTDVMKNDVRRNSWNAAGHKDCAQFAVAVKRNSWNTNSASTSRRNSWNSKAA